ncbi:hypothetical protein AOLI_G00150090 [Acnodon oligacanthus]
MTTRWETRLTAAADCSCKAPFKRTRREQLQMLPWQRDSCPAGVVTLQRTARRVNFFPTHFQKTPPSQTVIGSYFILTSISPS